MTPKGQVPWEVEQGMAYWNERLERAKERLAELKTHEGHYWLEPQTHR